MRRTGRTLLSLAVAAAVAAPTSAHAARSDDEEPGPWGRGTIVPSLGFGASFGSDIHILDLGLGASYFIINGLALGLSWGNTFLIYREDYKRAYPGIENETPSYIGTLIPSLQYVFMRQRRFSPYIRAGVGPEFHNRGRGTVGKWIAGPGAFVRIAGPVSLFFGIDFFASFPDDDWQEAFSYMGQSFRGCAFVDNPCSFNISPRLGLVFQIPTGGKRRRKKREEEPPPESVPLENPMDDEPGFQAEPEPVEPEPVEPPPSEPAQPPPAEEAPPTEPAPESGTEPPPETGAEPAPEAGVEPAPDTPPPAAEPPPTDVQAPPPADAPAPQ